MKTKLLLTILFFCTLFSNAQNLIAYYPFDGNANDASGNGYNGTINGNTTLTNDRFMAENRAFTFPNQSSNITLASTTNTNLENGFTLNAWVKYKNNNITAVIVCKHVCGVPNGFVFGIDIDGQIQLWLANSTSTWSTVRTNTTFVENRWYMMTASYDAVTGIAKIYINGEISGSGTVAYNNLSSNPISIGETYQNNCQPANLSGAIDELKIYDRPLSETEIIQEYNLTRNSLVAYYPFNGNANDESGNTINPTFIGAGVTLTTDRFGNVNKAYNFDGATNSYIRMPADLLPTTNRTISLWFNVPDVVNRPGLLGYGGNGSCGTTLLMGINLLGIGQYYVQGHCGNNATGYSYTTAPVNNWYHWVLTINGSTQKIYINGQLKSTDNTFSGSTVVAGKALSLGVITSVSGTAPYTDANVGYLNGKLDDVRIYDAAMTDTQILQLYNMELTGLVAHYPFNGNANDESGNENHGIVNGATLTSDRFGNASKAYSFTSPNHISVPNSNLFGDEFSVSYWFKISSYFGQRAAMSNVASPNGGFQQEFDGTTFAYILGYNFPLSSDPLTSNYTMQEPVNQWNHLVLTYKKTGTTSSESKLFINGYLKKTSTHSLSILFTPNATFYIGQNHSGLNFQGDLDDVRIYNRILSPTEIAHLFTNNDLKINNIENASTNNFYVSNNTLYFKNTQDLNSIKTVKVYNLLGQKVFDTSKIKAEIFLNYLTKGVYILKVENNDGKISSLKFLME